jgi:hypothetical protein
MQGPLGTLEHLGDRCGQTSPTLCLNIKLPPSAAGELVVLRAAFVLRCAPCGFNPGAPFGPVKCGIERSLLNPEDVAGGLLHPL